ncbi:porin family protein [Algiphilus aromaticivorans]|uniref:hypothetical protein n=1 Tax=Algiphilus aromaticivorans TaxID=382454 RepID=UPI0005C19D65|nr:hypothetical protein [Algiphilus aromaticivorans]
MLARVAAGALLLGGSVVGAQAAPEATEPRYSLGVALWDTEISGVVSDNERLDLEDDLALKSDNDLVFDGALRWGRFELLGEHARLRADGRNTLNRDITLGGLVLIPREETVTSSATVDDSLLALRWRIGGAGFSVSPGVTARHLDARVRLREGEGSAATRDVESVTEFFPMAHLGVASEFGAVRLSAHGNYVEYDGDRVFDVTAMAWLQPQLIAPLRIGLGWQLRDYRIAHDDGEDDADVRLSGAQLRMGLRW